MSLTAPNSNSDSLAKPKPPEINATGDMIRVRLGRRKPWVPLPKMVGAPFSVSYGMGTDSTGMLIHLRNEGIIPDVIQFADTGVEKPETYGFREYIDPWLEKNGFPPITVVKLESRKGYLSMADQLLANGTLPSLAFGGHSCSLKWKVAPMDKWFNNYEPAAVAWALGQKVVKAIGYDASPRDSFRRGKAMSKGDDPKYKYIFPLSDAGITREGCIHLIRSEGLPMPGKSACWFCPAAKKSELEELLALYPDLVALGLKIEATAKLKGFQSTKGLGRSWAWRDHLFHKCPSQLKWLDQNFDTGVKAWKEAELLESA